MEEVNTAQIQLYDEIPTSRTKMQKGITKQGDKINTVTPIWKKTNDNNGHNKQADSSIHNSIKRTHKYKKSVVFFHINISILFYFQDN